MSVTVRGAPTTIDAGAVDTLTIPVPTGVQAGDLLVAQVAGRGNLTTITPPSGWTLVNSAHSSTIITQAVYRRIATATEPSSYSWTGLGAAGCGGAMTALFPVASGVIDVVGAAGTAGGVNGTTATAPAVTTTTANDALVLFACISNAITWTPPAGYAEAYDFKCVAATQHLALTMSMKQAGSAGAQAAAAETASATGQWVAVQVAFLQGTSPPPATKRNVVYGYADGNLASQTYRTREVATIAAMLGPNAPVRTNISTTTYDGTIPALASDPAKPLADDIAANGLDWICNLHWKTAGADYKLPTRDAVAGDPTFISGAPAGLQGMQTLYTWAYNVVRRYGPGGTYNSVGWKGITKYEAWNEPDTTTGNCGAVDASNRSIKMAYADYWAILQAVSLAVRQAGRDMGFAPEVIGFCAAPIDTSWIKGVVDWAAANGRTNPLSFCDTVSVHVYMNNDPALPGGSYPPGADSTLTGATGQQFAQRINTVFTGLRPYLNAAAPAGYTNKYGNTNPEIAITEGGYAGDDVNNIYLQNVGTHTVLWEGPSSPKSTGTDGTPPSAAGDQATWGSSALQLLETNFASGRVRYYTPFNLLSNGGVYSSFTSDYLYWVDRLSASRDPGIGTTAIPSSFWKPWGVTYSAFVAGGGTVSPPAATFRLSAPSPTPVAGVTVSTPTATFAINALQPSVFAGSSVLLTVPTARFAISAPAPQVNAGVTIDALEAVFAMQSPSPKTLVSSQTLGSITGGRTAVGVVSPNLGAVLLGDPGTTTITSLG